MSPHISTRADPKRSVPGLRITGTVVNFDCGEHTTAAAHASMHCRMAT